MPTRSENLFPVYQSPQFYRDSLGLSNQRQGCLHWSCERVPPATGVRIPKIGKRGSRGQKTPTSQCSRGHYESKNPHFHRGALYRNGDFLTQSALFWGTGKWELFDPETTLFPILGILTPEGADAFARLLPVAAPRLNIK